MQKYVTINRNTFISLLVCLGVAVILAVSLAKQVAAKESSVDDTYSSLKIFTDALGLVQKNYVEPVKVKDLVEGGVRGMLAALDPHSSYLSPDDFKELQVETKGEFGGLGIEITVRDGILTVVSPIEDSPAARVGMLPGDQIIKINEEFTKDLSLVEAVKKMRGPKGSTVTLSVHRDKRRDLIPYTMVRDVIKVKSVRFRPLDDGYVYVRLAQFQDGSSVEFESALKDLTKQAKDRQIKGLVLDLRNDPGGLLTEAIRVSDLFLKNVVVVYTDGRLESQKQKFYARDDGDEPDFPIVAIINGGSASASEIVAGALQDTGRALIIGEQSFGKGSVQTVLAMDGGSALRLTTALYYTPSGRSIQAKGITPDILVKAKAPPVPEEIEGQPFDIKERDLPGAFKNPKADTSVPAETAVPSTEQKPADPKKASPLLGSRSIIEMKLEDLLKEDLQLAEALRLLKSGDALKPKSAIRQAVNTDVGSSAPTVVAQ